MHDEECSCEREHLATPSHTLFGQWKQEWDRKAKVVLVIDSRLDKQPNIAKQEILGVTNSWNGRYWLKRCEDTVLCRHQLQLYDYVEVSRSFDWLSIVFFEELEKNFVTYTTISLDQLDRVFVYYFGDWRKWNNTPYLLALDRIWWGNCEGWNGESSWVIVHGESRKETVAVENDNE